MVGSAPFQASRMVVSERGKDRDRPPQFHDRFRRGATSTRQDPPDLQPPTLANSTRNYGCGGTNFYVTTPPQRRLVAKNFPRVPRLEPPEL